MDQGGRRGVHTVIAKGAEVTCSLIEGGPDLVSRERRHGWIYKGFDAPGVKEAVDVYAKALREMNEALAKREWLAGTRFRSPISASPTM